MSLILEALRKSEAERRRGQAPGLFVEQMAVPVRRRATTPLWTRTLVLLLAAVLVAWGWREFGARAPAASADGATSAESRPAENGIAARDVGPVAADEVAPYSAPADPGVATAPVPAEPSVSHQPTAAPSIGPPAITPDITADPTPAASTANSATSNTAAPPATAANDADPDSATSASTDAATLPASAPTPVAASTPATSRPTPPPVPAPADEALPRLSELTGAERSQLPALKLSMHVYTDDPAQRFVILDGKRLREGDRAAEGVALEAIRRDGLVLSVHGRRLLLARP